MTDGNSSKEKPCEQNLEKAIPADALKYRDNFDEEEDFLESLAIWPVCPKCGNRRETVCPICHVTCDLFPLADIDYWDPPEATGAVSGDEPGSSASSGCQCGGSCGHHDHDHDHNCEHDHDKAGHCQCKDSSGTNVAEEAVAEGAAAEGAAVDNLPAQQEQPCVLPNKYSFSTQEGDDPMGIRSFSVSSEYSKEDFDDSQEDKVITRQTEVKLCVCHVCSEPFVPKFLSKCSHCGYDFDKPENTDRSDSSDRTDDYSEEFAEDIHDMSGTITVDLDNYIRGGTSDDDREKVNNKLFVALLILLGLGCAAMVYFYFLFK